MAGKSYYIKERNNYKNIYYVKLGQITKKEAKKHECPVHGINTLYEYKTEQEYKGAIEALIGQGKSVYE